MTQGNNARGLAVDSTGNPVIDPSENVKALSEAANKRQDDLREAFNQTMAAELRHIKELAELRAHHQRELDKAESERLNAIRQVDREEVTKSATTALTAIQTLAATQTTQAQSLATQLGILTAEINKRISALELASSEGKGKQGVSDPMMEKLMSRMDSLLETRSTDSGRSIGANWLWGIIVGGLAFIGMAIGIGSAIYAMLSK